MGRTGRTNKTTIAAAVILTIVAVAAVPVILTFYGLPSPYHISVTEADRDKASQPVTDATAVTKKCPFYIKDALANTALNATTIQLLDQNGNLIESITTAETGLATTGTEYTSGTQFTVAVSLSGYVTQYFPYTVPMMSKSDAATATNHYTKTFGLTQLGSYTIKVTDSAGTSYTSGTTTYNWTAKGVTQDTFTIAVYETAANRGWASSYDPINQQQQNVVAQMYFNGTGYNSLISGYGSMYTSGAVKNWFKVLPDSTLCRQVTGSGLVQKDGVTVFTITVNKGSFSSGCERLTIDLRDYFDTARFGNLGDGGVSDASLAAFYIDFIV